MSSTSIVSHTFEIASGETIALDMGQRVWPYGISIIPAAGATVTRKASNSARPGNKYGTPPDNDQVTSTFLFEQVVPVAYMQFSSASGTAEIDITGHTASRIPVHSSNDALTAKTVSPSIAVGEEMTFAASALFEYDFPADGLALTAVSAAPATATAAVDPNTGQLTIAGVASGTVNITVTATTPAEKTLSNTVAVTVTS